MLRFVGCPPRTASRRSRRLRRPLRPPLRPHPSTSGFTRLTRGVGGQRAAPGPWEAFVFDPRRAGGADQRRRRTKPVGAGADLHAARQCRLLTKHRKYQHGRASPGRGVAHANLAARPQRFRAPLPRGRHRAGARRRTGRRALPHRLVHRRADRCPCDEAGAHRAESARHGLHPARARAD